jgi:hypothetical protein
MVTRQTTTKRRTATKRRVPLATTGAQRMEEAKAQFHVAERKLQKAGRAAAVTAEERMEAAKTQLHVAERRLKKAGRAAATFARSYVREMNAAVQASREPMHSLWLTMKRTGRHIARDATEAWREVLPLLPKTMKPVSGRMARRTPA